jgi:hypothetical protein
MDAGIGCSSSPWMRDSDAPPPHGYGIRMQHGYCASVTDSFTPPSVVAPLRLAPLHLLYTSKPAGSSGQPASSLHHLRMTPLHLRMQRLTRQGPLANGPISQRKRYIGSSDTRDAASRDKAPWPTGQGVPPCNRRLLAIVALSVGSSPTSLAAPFL